MMSFSTKIKIFNKNYILFSTFCEVLVTALPAFDTSLPKPLTVLQPVNTNTEATVAIINFFMINSLQM